MNDDPCYYNYIKIISVIINYMGKVHGVMQSLKAEDNTIQAKLSRIVIDYITKAGTHFSTTYTES